MYCPVCKNAALVISERQGIEIDFCPQCRGIWLDRGELDKLIERAQQAMPAHTGRGVQHDDERHYHAGDRAYRTRKKKGFFAEMFDFD